MGFSDESRISIGFYPCFSDAQPNGSSIGRAARVSHRLTFNTQQG